MTNMRKSLFLSLCLASSLSLFNCGGSTTVDTETLNEVDQTNQGHEIQEVDPEVVSNIIQSIPSPLEISTLIEKNSKEYRKDYLNSTDKISLYGTSYEQALNLGIYGTDLGYTNIYDNSQDGIYYLDAVTELAEHLSIGQFFDVTTLKNLMKHSDNLDSLLSVTTDNFEKINTHLQEKKRSQLSVFLLVGGWIEGLNLLNEVNKENPNKELQERIGEQKDVLNLFIQLLSYYKHDTKVQELLTDLKKLEVVYKDVKIEFVQGDTQMKFDPNFGMMVPVSTSYSVVHINDEQIGKIHATVTEIRNKIIK